MDENFLASLFGGQPQTFGVPQSVMAYGQQQGGVPAGTPDTSFGVPADVASYGMQPPPGTGPSIDQAANVMQALNPAPAPQAPPQGDPAQLAPAPLPQQAPRPRHSLLDVIGGIADALATAGGAKAQYQPMLDARLARQNAAEDRTTAAGDHARQINLDNLKMALMQSQAQTAQSDAEKAREGQAIQYVQAVQAAGGDAGAAWAKAAGLAGVSSDRTAIIGQMIAADPKNEHGTLEGLDALRNGIEEYNTAPIQAYNPKTGQYEIVQVGKHGGKNITALDDGFTIPSSVMKVNTGGTTELRDGKTARLISRTTNMVSPDTAANIAGRTEIANINASKSGAKPGKDDDAYTVYSGARNQLKQMSAAIDDLVRDPNLSSATGYVAGGVDTPARQRILGKVAAIKGMAVPAATAILKAQGIQRPAQAEVLATANGLISDLGLIRQSTGDYINGAKRAMGNLKAKVDAMDANALRLGTINQDGSPASGAAPAPRRILPAPAGARPRASQPIIRNW